jgi:hypothetical protein
VFTPSVAQFGLDDPDLDVGGHPLGRALISAVGDMTARTTRRTRHREGVSPTEEETAQLTQRLMKTPMIQALLAAFAREIVDDQDVLEGIQLSEKIFSEKEEQKVMVVVVVVFWWWWCFVVGGGFTFF